MTQRKFIVKYTNQFKKDYKSALKRNFHINELHAVVNKLASGTVLEEKYRDHALAGQWIGHRECHIAPDWLLIYYTKKDTLVLTLARTGTHSDLFSK